MARSGAFVFDYYVNFVEYDGSQRSLLLYKVIDLLTDVEDDDDADDKKQRNEERGYEL